jgi:acetolactate synthase-1/2/3 large subunit
MTDPASSNTNGAVALLKTVRAGGARICFANPGTTELTLVRAMADVPEMRVVLCLFEGVATGAADGYSRVSGEVALTLLHLGPGFANGIANLHNARRAHSRIVNLIGDHARWHLPHDAPLTSDIRSLAAPVSVSVRYLESVEAIEEDVAGALHDAREAPGAISTLILPTDVMDAPAVPAQAVTPTAPLPEDVPHARIAAVAKRLRDSDAPILLLGGDTLGEAGIEAAAEVARRVGARLLMEPYPSIVTLGGTLPRVERQAYFPDDVLRQMGEAVVVLAGARAPISYFGYEGFPSRLVSDDRLVTLSDPQENGVAALIALAGALADLSAARLPAPPAAPPVSGVLNAETVVEALLPRLPEDAIISLEGSTLGGPWLRGAHRARRHRVMTNTGGAIGQGLPCALGAALAAPGRRIVSLQSDGSAQYTVQALWTMAHEKLPITMLIAANHRYGILQTELRRAGADLANEAIAGMTVLDDPKTDWVALATAYGVRARRVETLDELAPAIDAGLAIDGPMLIAIELP